MRATRSDYSISFDAAMAIFDRELDPNYEPIDFSKIDEPKKSDYVNEMRFIPTLHTKPQFSGDMIYITHHQNPHIFPKARRYSRPHLVIVTNEKTKFFWRGKIKCGPGMFKNHPGYVEGEMSLYRSIAVIPFWNGKASLKMPLNDDTPIYEYDPKKLIELIEKLRDRRINCLMSCQVHYRLSKLDIYFKNLESDVYPK